MRKRKGQSRSRDHDIASVEAALRRAALRAREEARRAGLKIPVYRNGRIVEVWPEEIRKPADAELSVRLHLSHSSKEREER